MSGERYVERAVVAADALARTAHGTLAARMTFQDGSLN